MTSNLLRSMYNKTIIRFGFCDIQNNQGLGKGYQPQPSASADNRTSTLIILDITKTSSNNCLLVVCILTRPTGSPKYFTTRKNTKTSDC